MGFDYMPSAPVSTIGSGVGVKFPNPLLDGCLNGSSWSEVVNWLYFNTPTVPYIPLLISTSTLFILFHENTWSKVVFSFIGYYESVNSM